MLDLILILTMFLVCGGIGLPVAEWMPARFEWRILAAPTLGLGVLAVAIPVAYRFGLTVPIIAAVAAVAALASLAVRGRRAMRSLAALSVSERRLAVAALACWLLALVVLLAPRWVGGEQFSVFQGNMWDQYGYLESAAVYARKPYSIVMAAGDHEFLKNPLFPLAQGQLLERPSVHLLYAVVTRIAPGQAYRLAYPFLVACAAQFVLVALCVLRGLLPHARPWAWLVAALVFPVGFWGQYVLDINAWSELASAPLLFLMFALLLHVAIGSSTDERGLRTAAVLGVVIAGAVYLYPEGFIIYATLVPVAIAALVVRARGFDRRLFTPLLGFAGLATTVLYNPILHHLLNQVTRSSGTKVPWWTYFQAFFHGRDGSAGAIDFVAGLTGLYFATPSASCGAAVVLRLAIALTIGGLVVALVLLGSGRVRIAGEPPRAVLAAWAVASLVLLAPAAYLAHQQNYWPAGKVVAFAAPVFMTLLAVPIGYGFARPALRPLRWIAIVFVAFQIACGFARIVAAHAPDGIHYAPPYPAITVPRFKQDYGWDLRGLERVLTTRDHVLLQPMDPWPESALMVFLYTRGIPFAKSTPVNTNFGAGRDVGTFPAPSTTTVELGVERDAFILHFRNGRPDVRVVSRGEMQ